MSAVTLPQGKAWVELEEMTAGCEWEVEVAQGGQAAEANTEAAAGMRREAVNFSEEEKTEVKLFSIGTFLQITKSSMEKGNQKAALVPLISGNLGNIGLLIKKMTGL